MLTLGSPVNPSSITSPFGKLSVPSAKGFFTSARSSKTLKVVAAPATPDPDEEEDDETDGTDGTDNTTDTTVSDPLTDDPDPDDDNVLELSIYDDIGQVSWWSEGITAQQVKYALEKHSGAGPILLRINSPGGDAIEGVAIYNVLVADKRKKVVKVDGIAASAASVIAMAGDTITMGTGTLMMIHNAWSGVQGYATDLRKGAEILDTISGCMADIYSKRTGKPAAEILDMMGAETWLNAADCMTHGFSTSPSSNTDEEMQVSEKALAMAKASFGLLSTFKHTPDAMKFTGSKTVSMPAAASLRLGSTMPPVTSTDVVSGRLDMSTPITVVRPSFSSISQAISSLRLNGQSSEASINGHSGILALRKLGTTSISPSPSTSASASVAEPTSISGLLAPYNSASCDLGGFVEVYQPGCFTSWLSSTSDYRVSFNHDPNSILGRRSNSTARLWDETDGLHYSAVLPDTTTGRDLRTLISRGDITEASAAFFILAHRWEIRNGIRTRVVEKAAVLEGGPQTFAAYSTTTATIESAVKEQEVVVAKLVEAAAFDPAKTLPKTNIHSDSDDEELELLLLRAKFLALSNS